MFGISVIVLETCPFLQDMSREVFAASQGDMMVLSSAIANLEVGAMTNMAVHTSGSCQLAEAIAKQVPGVGLFTTSIKGLSLVRVDSPSAARAPVVYEPCLYVVAQGAKHAFLGEELYRYDAMNFLVLSVDLPLECEVVEATEQHPYLAIKLDVDTDLLSSLVLEMADLKPAASSANERGIFVSPMDQCLNDSLLRLIESLNDKAKTRVLSPMVVKEILFHVLQGPQGGQLLEFAKQDRNHYRVAQSIRFIRQHYASPLEVNELASAAGMSDSSYHHYFKAITNASPLQYIKTMRLHEAKKKITVNSLGVSDAAFQVGYGSPSQFSREYKRMFGRAPSQERLNS